MENARPSSLREDIWAHHTPWRHQRGERRPFFASPLALRGEDEGGGFVHFRRFKNPSTSPSPRARWSLAHPAHFIRPTKLTIDERYQSHHSLFICFAWQAGVALS